MLQLTDSRPALYLLVLAAAAILGGRLVASFFRRSKHTPEADGGDEKRPHKTWVPVAFESPAPAPYPDWDVHTTKPLPYRPFKYGPK